MRYIKPDSETDRKLQEMEKVMDKYNIQIMIGWDHNVHIRIDDNDYVLYDMDMRCSVYQLPRQTDSDVLRLVED